MEIIIKLDNYFTEQKVPSLSIYILGPFVASLNTNHGAQP